MKPAPFSLDTYIAWHEALVPVDRPLREKLSTLREKLKTDARDDLAFLFRILTYMFTYARNEFLQVKKAEITYQTPLQQALLSPPAPLPANDGLFKSVDSIVNKMWRKADETPQVTLANLVQHITDLIRTDVRTETLESAQFLAQRMNRLPELIYVDDLKEEFSERVSACEFESAMRMESGYFAYHGLVRFKSGNCIEVQIYSALMSEWRRLSHLLYERVRINPIEHHEFGTQESRLVSLGHMLHLAECELQRLSQDMKH